MKLYINSPSTPLNRVTHDRIEEAAKLALSRFGDLLVRVDMLIHDENGPRGGIDKRCVVRAVIRQRNDVVVESRASSSWAAVKQALEKCRKKLDREQGRLRSSRLKPIIRRESETMIQAST